MIRAGTMRERIALSRLTVTDDPAFGRQESYTALASVWAHVEAESGTEANANGVESRVTWKLRTRFRDIQPTDRITWGSRTLHIESALPDPKRTELNITAHEVPA